MQLRSYLQSCYGNSVRPRPDLIDTTPCYYAESVSGIRVKNSASASGVRWNFKCGSSSSSPAIAIPDAERRWKTLTQKARPLQGKTRSQRGHLPVIRPVAAGLVVRWRFKLGGMTVSCISVVRNEQIPRRVGLTSWPSMPEADLNMCELPRQNDG